MSAPKTEDLRELVAEAVVYADDVQRMYDLAAASEDEKDIAVRAHACVVTSMFLTDAVREQVLAGTQDEQETLVYAVLAVTHKLVGQSLDKLRAFRVEHPDEHSFDQLIEGAEKRLATLEPLCAAHIELLTELGEIQPDQHHARFVEMLPPVLAALTSARTAYGFVTEFAG